MMVLFATTPTSWLQFIYDSPVLVAIITVFAVKALDVLNERLRLVYTDRKENRSGQHDLVRDLEEQIKEMNLQNVDRIKTLEKGMESLNIQNDGLIIENAKLSARLSLVEAQNASQIAELARVRQERDEMRKRMENANEVAHRVGLQLKAADIRIKQLEKYIKELEERLQTFMEQSK